MRLWNCPEFAFCEFGSIWFHRFIRTFQSHPISCLDCSLLRKESTPYNVVHTWYHMITLYCILIYNLVYIYTCNLKRLRICNPFEKDSFLNEKNTFSYPGTYFEEGTYFGGILIKKFWIHHVLQHSFSFSICFSSTYLQNTIWFLQSSNSSSNIRSLGSCPTHLDFLFHPQAVFVHQRAYDLSGNTLGTPEVERSRSG